MEQIAIIADDLTGASDTGVQFAQQGYHTMVIVNPQFLDLINHNNEVWSINSDTREVSLKEAYDRVDQIARRLREGMVQRVYKKIDSTFRGHPGAEIEALMDAWESSLALVVPTFPGNYRVVQDSRIYLLNEAETTEVGEQAKEICHIPSVLQKEMVRKVGSIRLEVVRKGSPKLVEEIKKVKGQNPVQVIDAITNQDLEIIAEVIRELPRDTLVVGSAGLANYLPMAWNLSRLPLDHTEQNGVIMVLAGSKNGTTIEQLNHIRETFKIEPFRLEVEALVNNQSTKEIERLLKRIKESSLNSQSPEQKIIVVTMDPSYQAPTEVRNIGGLIASTMGVLVKQLLSEYRVNGLVITGGDTAYHICQILGTTGIALERELMTGIPYGYMVGGSAHGIPVATKAGGFGQRDALTRTIEYFLENNQQKVRVEHE